MYRISEEIVKSLDNSTGTAYIEAVIIASNSSAIPAYNAIPKKIMLPGSVAIIPESGAVYVLTFNNEWEEWTA